MHGMGIDGYMLHRADPRDLTVGIVHHPSEGYKLGFDGQTIKEELDIREFVKRLSTDRHGTRGYNPVPHEKMEHDIREILIILSRRNQTEIMHLAETLDRTYSDLIRRGRLVLADHTVSMRGRGPAVYNERESLGNTERSVTQSCPMTPDEAYKRIKDEKNATDKEIYYTLS